MRTSASPGRGVGPARRAAGRLSRRGGVPLSSLLASLSPSARSRRRCRACAGSACRRGTLGPRRVGRHRADRAISSRARYSRTRRSRPRPAALLPQVNGPWLATSTAGDLLGRDAALAERLDDHEAGVPLVVALDLGLRQRAGHRDVAAEVVGVRGAHAADRQRGLRERRRVLRVRVHDAAAGRTRGRARGASACRTRGAASLSTTSPVSSETSTMSRGRRGLVRHAARLDRRSARPRGRRRRRCRTCPSRARSPASAMLAR